MDMAGKSFAASGRRSWACVCCKAGRLYWAAMMAALILPPVIGRSLPAAVGPVGRGLAVAVGLVGCAAVCQMARRKEKSGPGGLWRRFPRVTMGYVAFGALLYWVLPHDTVGGLCDLALDKAGFGDLLRVTLARSLLHDTVGHLFTNAVLLGLLGLWLEPGLGTGRTLAVLVLGSCLTSLIGLNLLLSQVDVSHGAVRLLHYPPAGGTGALAAFLGLGAAERGLCRPGEADPGEASLIFDLMGVGTPLLAGFALMGVFSGHAAPVTGLDGMAGYWGQVGGGLGGLAMAVAMRTLGAPAIYPPPIVPDRRNSAVAPPCDMAGCSLVMR